MTAWIDITEYATKYGVSQSTLRRRIRSKTIPYKMEKGKYLLEDSQQTIESAPLYIRLHAAKPARQTFVAGRKPVSQRARQLQEPSDLSLRSEYESALRENRKLKEHIAELETLIKVLEAEIGA